jgi:hypothetical protein
MQHARPVIRLCSVLAATATLTGCFGIAHTSVNVPPLEVRVDRPDKAIGIVEVVRPEFYGENQALLALVTDAVDDKYPPYDRRSLRTSANATPLIFPKEDRYIGFPLFVVGIPPSEETSKKHTVFFRIGSNGDVHRVDIRGNKVTVQKTSLATARSKLPAVLNGMRPTPPDPRWRIWFDAESKFHDSLQWEPSSELSVIELRRTPERDVLIVKIAEKHDS